jgi:hypothetical protein
MRDEIAESLWPIWDGGGWVGDSKAHMERLTLFDLSLMWETVSLFKDPVSAVAGAKDHCELFAAEDLQNGGRPGDFWSSYLPELDPDKLEHSPPRIYTGGGTWAGGSTAILLKHSLQRPRPFQIALWMNTPPPVRLHGTTADSPSMISGHCLDGCLAGTWAAWFLEFEADGLGHLDWDRVRPALQQWVVDIGDRRVMAQIHYPSDNIGSWWVALSFLRRLEASGSETGAWMRVFLKEAIRRSAIYRALTSKLLVPSALWPTLVRAVQEQ